MSIDEAKEEFDFFNEGDYITRGMSIAKDVVLQELENTKADLYESNNRIVDLLLILGDRDRMIDLMITWISENENPFDDCYEYSISCADIDCKDCIRKYFEERCKNAKD